jgi:hypothetical protein
MVNKFLEFTAVIFRVLTFLILACVAGYAVYIWWDMASNAVAVGEITFLEFAATLALFFVTIPIAPIYIGVKGNWEPTLLIFAGLIISDVLYVGAKKCEELIIE